MFCFLVPVLFSIERRFWGFDRTPQGPRRSMARKRKTSLRPVKASKREAPQQQVDLDCYEGERLDNLLSQLDKSIELARLSKGELPEKIWIKQQFAIGVNDVTRVLERMHQVEMGNQSNERHNSSALSKASTVSLQAVILASDCNPRWLTKHIPTLASSRQVPVISVKDNKRSSLRLGELVKLKTAMAIGIKVKGSRINKTVDEILGGGASAEDTAENAQQLHA